MSEQDTGLRGEIIMSPPSPLSVLSGALKIADKFENIDQTGLHEAGYGPDDFE